MPPIKQSWLFVYLFVAYAMCVDSLFIYVRFTRIEWFGFHVARYRSQEREFIAAFVPNRQKAADDAIYAFVTNVARMCLAWV